MPRRWRFGLWRFWKISTLRAIQLCNHVRHLGGSTYRCHSGRSTRRNGTASDQTTNSEGEPLENRKLALRRRHGFDNPPEKAYGQLPQFPTLLGNARED